MNINVSDKLIYLGAGCGIGMVLGLLFAPQSGEEIRHNLTHQSGRSHASNAREDFPIRHRGYGEPDVE